MERFRRVNNAVVISSGDFNLPKFNWTNKSVKPGAQYARTQQMFIDTLDDLGLSQIVEVPTRGINTLDLVITNHPSKIIRAETLPGISDHDIVFVAFDMIPMKKNPTRFQGKYRFMEKQTGKQ
jgi:hypothetical protein